MPRVGLELMIPAFERAKTVHDLDRAATVIGRHMSFSSSSSSNNNYPHASVRLSVCLSAYLSMTLQPFGIMAYFSIA
jgi:hypothetical protein